MLKTIRSPNKPAPNKNDGNKSAFNRNNNNRLVSKKNNGNGEVNGFDVSRNGVEYAKKSEKSSKSENSSKSRISKSEKTSKSKNLAKSGKNLSKSRNSTNFDATEVGSKFLTPNTGIAFNHLWLAFIEAPIL